MMTVYKKVMFQSSSILEIDKEKKNIWGSFSILYGIPAFLHKEKKISHCHKILFQILVVPPPVSHSH